MVFVPEQFTIPFIVISGVIGILFALFQAWKVSRVTVKYIPKNKSDKTPGVTPNPETPTTVEEGDNDSLAEIKTKSLVAIQGFITKGAKAFLFAEYRVVIIFLICFSVVLFLLLGTPTTCGAKVLMNNGTVCDTAYEGCQWVAGNENCWMDGLFTTIAFLIGGVSSVISGYIGMRIAVYTNARTATMCQVSWTEGFNVAFRAGSVMGFALTSLGLIMLYIIIECFKTYFKVDTIVDPHSAERLFEAVAGYGLGGSSVALFGRVGGGIYTKAADVGADLVGKVEAGIPEDDPRNPAVIADNVGDNVGDIAGMGADLFGSFAESSCAALLISSVSPELNASYTALLFPLLISAGGILASFITSFFATSIPCLTVKREEHIERNLKIQLILSTVLATLILGGLTYFALPEKFCVYVLNTYDKEYGFCYKYANPSYAYGCILFGLWSGLIIGFYTDYMTSYSYKPVQEVSASCETGAATNIIFGLALGYLSNVLPVFCLAITIFFSFYFANMYGVALSALGMLGTLACSLTIDGYGPITDNAGGIAEMAGLSSSVRRKTDALDAAGNTTAAIGKGFAIGSASLVSLALFGAFVTRTNITGVDILQPLTFAGLIVGAMLPYWFTAMTMKSVGKAAKSMVEEVRRQFREKPGIMDRTEEPDYEKCVAISTHASLKEMIAPGCLVMLTPLITGFFFGVNALTGVLAGGLVSGVQMAISASNTGGAWDNAKKYVEKGNHGGKGSDAHKAAVVGDTVGDPLKDTSGPSLNILMKLMAIISLVFAPFFTAYSLNKGYF
ncbi:hypothetical protein WA158_001119 [Blastocystis sp. Blastoise]